MQRLIKLILILILALNVTGCSKTQEETTIKQEVIETNEKETLSTMKLFINDKQIPVMWEDNLTVDELLKDVENREIVVEMSMYGGNEQFGYLGKNYPSENHQMTTSLGDIVLYDDCNIVVFYGSNSWSYTKLGRMELERQEIIDLLSNGNVTLTLSK